MITDAEGNEVHFVGRIHAKEEREELRVVFEFKASIVEFPFCKCSQVFRNVILEPSLNVESKSRMIGRGAGRVWRQSFSTDSGKEDSRSETDIWLQPGLMIAEHKIKRRHRQDAKVCALKSCARCHARYCGVLKSMRLLFYVWSRVKHFRFETEPTNRIKVMPNFPPDHEGGGEIEIAMSRPLKEKFGIQVDAREPSSYRW